MGNISLTSASTSVQSSNISDTNTRFMTVMEKLHKEQRQTKTPENISTNSFLENRVYWRIHPQKLLDRFLSYYSFNNETYSMKVYVAVMSDHTPVVVIGSVFVFWNPNSLVSFQKIDESFWLSSQRIFCVFDLDKRIKNSMWSLDDVKALVDVIIHYNTQEVYNNKDPVTFAKSLLKILGTCDSNNESRSVVDLMKENMKNLTQVKKEFYDFAEKKDIIRGANNTRMLFSEFVAEKLNGQSLELFKKANYQQKAMFQVWLAIDRALYIESPNSSSALFDIYKPTEGSMQF